MAISSAASAGLLRRNGDTSLSVFGAWDKVSEKPGLGVSLMKNDRGLTTLTAAAFSHSILLQSSQLRPLVGGVLPIYAGMTVGYSFATNDGSVQMPGEMEVANGFMTGLEVVFAKTQPSAGLSFDLRASSMTKSVNPIKWISDPDVLWFGAGLSYSF